MPSHIKDHKSFILPNGYGFSTVYWVGNFLDTQSVLKDIVGKISLEFGKPDLNALTWMNRIDRIWEYDPKDSVNNEVWKAKLASVSSTVQIIKGICMSSKKGRRKRKEREAVKPDAKVQKKATSDAAERPALKETQSTKVDHAKEIRRLISGGKIKSAVNRAKQVHKNLGTKESEAILVEAYIARILEMIENGLTVEAEVLLDMVRKRHSLPDRRLAEIRAAAAARGGVNNAFLAPLSDPSIPPEQQAAILKIVKEKVVDLNSLTACTALSPDHPLKLQAAAISKAFEAVTTGPVDETEIALPNIPRRSPLAPWKMLIKALFYFYRREDALCESCLQAVETVSAPGRLVPIIRAMVSEKTWVNPGENALVLMEKVTGNRKGMKQKLQDIESALTAGKLKELSRAIRDAVALCQQSWPELADRLKQHISIRSYMIDANEKAIQKAIGGPSLKNAYFWKLFARAAEIKGDRFSACARWNEFMKHAVHEGIFSANGMECSVIYVYMANLLADMADSDFDWARLRFENSFKQSKGFASYYKEQPRFISDAVNKNKISGGPTDFLYPERLYGRACEIDPSSEIFLKWMEWMEKGHFQRKHIDEVALFWHKVLPHDVRPLMALAKSAEKKNAFKKCLTYLDEAEQMDGLHPGIKKIRLRILAATAIRHLKQKKPHLAKKDLMEMEALPLFKAGDRPAFLTALRWVCALIEGAEPELGRLNNELVQQLGSQLSATRFLQELLKTCGLSEKASGGALNSGKKLKVDDAAFAIARACLLGDDVGVSVAIPPEYKGDMEEAFKTNVPGLNASMLGAIAEAALRGDYPELAYAVSGAGLLKGAPTSARFLLLRARSLPSRERARKNNCIDAAIALARRERDMELIDEAIELRRNRREEEYLLPFLERRMEQRNFSNDPEALDDLLRKEREAREYPHTGSGPDFPKFYDEDFYDDDDEDDEDCRHCDVKDCPDRKAEYAPEFDDDDWDDDGDDDDDDDWDDDDEEWDEDDIKSFEALYNDGLLDLPPEIPSKAIPLLLKIALKYGNGKGGLPDFDALFEKDPVLAEKLFKIIFETEGKQRFGDFDSGGPSSGSQKKKKKRKGKR